MVFKDRKIVVAMDGSENANKAAEWAINFAKDKDAKVIAVYVVQHAEKIGSKAAGEKAIEYAVKLGKEAAVEVNPVIVEHKIPANGKNIRIDAERKSPSEGIIEVAEDNNADLIVMGTKGMTGLSHILLGSVAENVVRHSKIPVLVVR